VVIWCYCWQVSPLLTQLPPAARWQRLGVPLNLTYCVFGKSFTLLWFTSCNSRPTTSIVDYRYGSSLGSVGIVQSYLSNRSNKCQIWLGFLSKFFPVRSSLEARTSNSRSIVWGFEPSSQHFFSFSLVFDFVMIIFFVILEHSPYELKFSDCYFSVIIFYWYFSIFVFAVQLKNAWRVV